MRSKSPVIVRIAVAVVARHDGEVRYQDIEVTGTPDAAARTLGAIFRSGVTRLADAPAPADAAPVADSLGALYGNEVRVPAAVPADLP